MLPHKVTGHTMRSGTIFVLASISLLSTAKAAASHKVFDSHRVGFRPEPMLSPRTAEHETDFDWQKITPSPSLKWVKCYAGLECARFEVPLDYSEPTGDKAAVALLRIKAKVSSECKEYRGPILLNPGGPGGSGVADVKMFGEGYQKIWGNEYDIVGFDPRGIGETTPKVFVFHNDIEEAYWEAGTPPLFNSTADSVRRAFFRAHLYNDLAAVRSGRAAQYVSTVIVARDMLSITKAHGRDRLQYYGRSYGTVLGATFASMFPNNVERMVIDGVVDFDLYISDVHPIALMDTDKILQFIYDRCADAGPAACPLYANTSALVRQRVDAIFTSIKETPVPAINGSQYALIDYTRLKQGFYSSLYHPFEVFPRFAQALAALEAGDGRPALALLSPLPNCNTQPMLGAFHQVNELAVRCGEAEPAIDTIADNIQYFEYLSKFSIFADVWTGNIRVPCSGWKVRARERFTGPFAANTSFPLLIIGNTADPVTPLLGAQRAARNYVGSALLTVNTPGHSSRAAKSVCVDKIVRKYFAEGELPRNGTVCEIESVLFENASKASPN